MTKFWFGNNFFNNRPKGQIKTDFQIKWFTENLFTKNIFTKKRTIGQSNEFARVSFLSKK